MATLLLRLAAPMQAWGDESKYDIRQTWREPSKSGVIGLLAAALGLRRDSEEIPILSAALRMGVRVEMPGRVIQDFHTALAPKYTAKHDIRYEQDGSVMRENAPYVTERYYLCDACFLVGLESADDSLLHRLETALASPCFPLYLGRRACPPTLPLYLGIKNLSLTEALKQEPWRASEWYRNRHAPVNLRLVIETEKGVSAWYSLRDDPTSFSPVHRRYGPRGVEKEQLVTLADDTHDPFQELGIGQREEE